MTTMKNSTLAAALAGVVVTEHPLGGITSRDTTMITRYSGDGSDMSHEVVSLLSRPPSHKIFL